MSPPNLLVIADPASSHLQHLAAIRDKVYLRVANDPERLKEYAPEADAVLFADGRGGLLNLVLPLATKARWIHSLWTGVEHVTTEEMLAHPAPLTNGRGVFREPLADWVVAVMLYFSFDLARVIRQQQERRWEPFISSSLRGRTLGIVGYGALGSAAGERARAFGMKIAALRRRPELTGADSSVDSSFGPSQIEEMLAASDYVLAATPLTPETRGMIGARQIASMKPTAVIINIGRGPVIDEAALIQALENGKIRGAALDVFTEEPLPAESPLWRLPNVLISPHTADRVQGFLDPAFDCFFDNLDRFINGQPLMNLVDKHAGY